MDTRPRQSSSTSRRVCLHGVLIVHPSTRRAKVASPHASGTSVVRCRTLSTCTTAEVPARACKSFKISPMRRTSPDAMLKTIPGSRLFLSATHAT